MANTKLNKQVQDIIVESLTQGAPIVESIKRANISPNTFYLWMNRGEFASDSSRFRKFRIAVTRAKQAQYDTILARIQQAGEEGIPETVLERVVDGNGEIISEKYVTRHVQGDWRALAKYLELSAPDRFRRRELAEHIAGGSDNKLNVHLHFDDGERDGGDDDRHVIEGESSESDGGDTPPDRRIEAKPDERQET